MSNSEPANVQQSGTVMYQPVAEDDVGLFEILTILKRYRWVMLGVFFFVLFATVLIVLLLPKVYRAEIIINPPLTKDVEQLNIFDIETNNSKIKGKLPGNYFYEILEEEVYDKFIRFLNSKQLQYNFFKENNLLDHLKDAKSDDVDELKVFQEEFSDNIKLDDLRFVNKNELETIFISLEGHREKLIVEWLNKYVIYVDEYTAKSIVNGINKKIQLQVEGLSKQIESLRDVEMSRRLDMIEQYKEAVVIADTLGLTEQVSISLASYDKLAEKMGLTVNPGEIPLYLRGGDALRAELKMLKQRKNDDPFIPDLRDLQQRVSFLTHLNVMDSAIHSANVDQFAFVSNKSVKPKRLLIVAIGFFLGCLLAVFTALIKNWYETATNRQRLENERIATVNNEM